MTSVNGSFSRKELLKQSLREGGFGSEGRIAAWLYLLDLQHLASELEASTSKLREADTLLQLSPPSLASPLTPNEVPLDSDGWQVPQLSHLDTDQEDDRREWEGEEWSVAMSKRQRRRKGGSENKNAMHRDSRVGQERYASGSGGTTVTSDSGGTSEKANSRDQSQSRPDIASDNGIYGEERREENRRRKRKKRRKGEKIDIEASGILLPSPEVVEDERDESLKHDWIQADERAEKSRDSFTPHQDEQQVALDINRSFIGLSDRKVQELRRKQLNEIIVGVLRRHPNLSYYQGYHDIISVILLALIPQPDRNNDVDKALHLVIDVASRLSLHLLRDNMTVTMEPSMGHLKLLRNLLRQVDFSVSLEVESASPLPYFALPWLISLFAHELTPELSFLVFDYILARGPSSVIYLAVALILFGRDETSIADAAEKHHSLSQLPSCMTSKTLPIIFASSDVMLEKYPVESIGNIMGSRSMLLTWSQLPLATSNEAEIPTPWMHADALAEAILTGGVENIVIDALPTPPASDDGWSEKEDRKDKRSRRRPKDGQRGASVLAFVGAVGAVGVAALLMYGAGRSGVSFT